MQTTQTSSTPDASTLIRQGQQLAQDAAALVTQTRAAAGGVQTWAAHAIDTRPYVVLGAAAATGYVLAGGLASPLTGLMVRTAGRFLLARLLASFTASPLTPPLPHGDVERGQ